MRTRLISVKAKQARRTGTIARQLPARRQPGPSLLAMALLPRRFLCFVLGECCGLRRHPGGSGALGEAPERGLCGLCPSFAGYGGNGKERSFPSAEKRSKLGSAFAGGDAVRHGPLCTLRCTEEHSTPEDIPCLLLSNTEINGRETDLGGGFAIFPFLNQARGEDAARSAPCGQHF